MALYHRDLGFPATVRLWSGVLPLRFGPHSREQAGRYAQTLPLPATLDTRHAVPVEVDVDAGRVVKTLYRLPYTANSDLCLVVARGGFVVTLWLNNRDDCHRTLDRSRYVIPINR